MKSWFYAKPLRVSYETVKDPYFPTKRFLQFRSEKMVFQQNVLPVYPREEPLKVQ